MSKVLVFGHANPDTDSIVSAISYAYLLNQTGFEATAYALGAPSEETQFALDHFGVSAPQVIAKAADVIGEGDVLALVDHNEAQIAQTIASGALLTIIASPTLKPLSR